MENNYLLKNIFKLNLFSKIFCQTETSDKSEKIPLYLNFNLHRYMKFGDWS